MENIYKIKVRSSADPRWLYPSERRYSASTVLGLGVVHLALSVTALLLASLTLTANKEIPNLEAVNVTTISDSFQGNQTQNNAEIEEARINLDKSTTNLNMYTSITFAPCLMSLGSLGAGLSALLAWKRWYIDHNIKWFFFMSLASTFTSTLCLVIVTTLTALSTCFLSNPKINVKYAILINILIASVLEWLWSILSTKIAYRGMKNNYPEDIVLSRSHGKIEVNTIHKGNKKGKCPPPDILNHFPVSGKFAKYFPKKRNGNLPKDESSAEYKERVNRFLSTQVENSNG